MCVAVEDGPDSIADREMWCIGNGSGGGTRRGRLGSGREEAEACCFKSKGDDRGGRGINGGINTRDEFLTLEQSTCQASATNLHFLSLKSPSQQPVD